MEHIYRHIPIEIAKYFFKTIGIDIHWIIILVIVIIILFNLCRYIYRLYNDRKENSKEKVEIRTALEKAQKEHSKGMSLEEAVKLFDETFGEKEDLAKDNRIIEEES